MTWTPWHDLRVRTAAVVAFLALAFAVRAATVALAEPQISPAPPLSIAIRGITRPAPTPAPLAQLVALAPFGISDAAPNAVTTVAAVPPITLVGTLAGAEAPAAICRLGASTARILHVGDTLGGWRLQQVNPGRAVFVDGAFVRHELRLSPVGK